MRGSINIFLVVFVWLSLTKLDNTKLRINFDYVMGFRKETEVIVNQKTGESKMNSYTVIFSSIKEFQIKVKETPPQIDSLIETYFPILEYSERKFYKP